MTPGTVGNCVNTKRTTLSAFRLDTTAATTATTATTAMTIIGTTTTITHSMRTMKIRGN